MRAINENTLSILKSQRMIGQDRFNYELKLEGYEAGYSDIKETLTQTINDSALFADYCIRADGKVLLAYLKGAGIYLKVIDSEDEMLSTYNSGSGGNLFYTLGEVESLSCFTLLRLKNSKLLLIITDIGSFANAIPFATKIYTSENGLGDDFILTSTLSQRTRTKADKTYCKSYVSKAAQADDGSVIFATYKSRASGSYDFVDSIIFKSSDSGVTWYQRHLQSYNTIGTGSLIQYRSMVVHGSFAIVVKQQNYASVYSDAFVSYDHGDTWTYIVNDFSSIPKDSTGNHYLIDFASDSSGSLFMIKSITNRSASLYKAISTDNLSYDLLNTWSNWQLIVENISMYDFDAGFLTISPRGTIHYLHKYSASTIKDVGMKREKYSAVFPASSISISKGRGSANTMTIAVDNKDAALHPLNPNSELYGIINLNKQIIVKMGYGEDIIETFTGLIDEFSFKSFPHLMDISCRDHLKKALDQTITEGNQQTVSFENTAIESIFGYLCYLGGIETGTIEATGIKISKVFSWQSYADAFQFLADLASFEYGADEYGKLYFRRDYQPNNMAIAYTFEEGVDITSMSYKLSDDDLYYRVKAYGKSGDTVLVYDAPFVDAAKYNILPQKILKVDATEASTVSELRTIAERALYLMNSRTAIVEFEAIAVPWLQVGDFIQVYERSSMSTGIYRISSMTLNLTPKRFTMRLSCNYYGDSIVIGELPTETASQIVDPNLNLIPEMTSNTAPSGVARASSIYNGTYEPWQALNSTDADYYWNSIASTGWIEYQFAEKTIIDKYMLKARQALIYNDAMPKNWTFEAFDGESWIVLDTRTNQSAWGISEQRQYLFANTKAYIKYRLNVSANNGYNRLQLEQLAMYYGGGS